MFQCIYGRIEQVYRTGNSHTSTKVRYYNSMLSKARGGFCILPIRSRAHSLRPFRMRAFCVAVSWATKTAAFRVASL